MSTWKGRSRWTQQDASAALTALDRSGLSVAMFAEREGVDAQRLYSWRRKLWTGDFVEVSHRADAVARSAPCVFEVTLRSGHVVRFGETFDEAALRRLIALLEQREC